MDQVFQSAGEGHRLSSSSTSSGTTPSSLTTAELRARRLAALTGRTTNIVDTTNMESKDTRQRSYVNTTGNEPTDNTTTANTTTGNTTAASNNNVTMNEYSNTIKIETKPISSHFIHQFNSIMWDNDSRIITETDKLRWFDQGIHTKILLQQQEDEDEEDNNDNVDNDEGKKKQQSVQQQHDSWGLLQSHGGPCGILAALQAELITNLNIYDYLMKHKQQGQQNDYYKKKDIERGLATSIATILVRACLASNISKNNNKNEVVDSLTGSGTFEIQLILPKMSNNNSNNTSNSSLGPILDESMLECISIRNHNGYNVVNENNKNYETPNRKRVKQLSDLSPSTKNIDEIRKILIEAVTKYILSSESNQDDNSLCSKHQKKRLEHFYHNGGVMLLTMSIVATRGVDRIKNDMDAGTAHHLTAQFGHSSQELINLLLTGQATTNIFDNTMTLGGSLQCHGIQSQPSIGYLSQLEALRYCSVGDFYKCPKNPVWVIGSTSHFSVLFGSMQCLKESESDLLLQQCRQAFKSVEGAEENGFIPVTELGSVLTYLDLDLNEGVSTLAASLEMSGAGIILWNDFWKKVSRLKTGATLGNVVVDDEELARQLQAQFNKEQNDTSVHPQTNDGKGVFETYDNNSFQLFHYNGMRGGELASVSITRMNAEDAVGANASLVDASAGISIHHGVSDDLESVIRTKYPSCMFDWGGKQTPSLH